MPLHVPCAHCGLPVPDAAPPDPEHPQFCCHGCDAVYQMMAATGLGAFYALRQEMGQSPAGQPATETRDGRYAHYDDPEFLAQFSTDNSTIQLHLDGVHCAACVWVMDQLPEVVPGVTLSRLDYGRSRLSLSWDPERIRLSAVAEFLHGLGYGSSPLGLQAEAARKREARTELVRLGAMGAIAGNIMMISIALYAGALSGIEARFVHFFEWTSLLLALPAVTYGAFPFYRSAWSGLRMGVAHMDLPVALGIVAGFVASVYATVTGVGEVYYDSVAMLVFLLLAGRAVQRIGQRAAMSRAELLVALTPGTAWRWAGETWDAVPAHTLRVGDRVRVLAGETLPVDGCAEGAGHLDQSLLTGESRPVPVMAGASVFAGTVNVGDALVLEATASGAETRLGRLVEYIERADTERAPVVRLADRISGWFVLVVISLAVVGGVAWWFIDPSRIFDVVVSLLVVSCPCALGLATPMAVAVARGRAAAAGVLVRSNAAIERLGRVEHVWFDKTGTLTEGQLTVTDVTGADAWLRGAVGALERRSAHPVARALSAWGGVIELKVEAVLEVPGRGISGRVDGREVEIGAPLRLAPEGLPDALEAALSAALAGGETPVLVVVDGVPTALLMLGDKVRADSEAAVASLKAMGLSVGILSGDHAAVAKVVGARLGIEDARGGCLPEDKASVVAGQAGTAMVGDGFNDAAALRAAGVGIAVHGGAEVAMQVADVFLGQPGPKAVAAALVGGRRTLAVIRRNLIFSLIYNVFFASLALLGHISPLAAAVLMPMSSLTVVASSVLSRTFEPVSIAP